MYNIIPFIIIMASLAVILFIIIKKFPTLSSIDVESLSKEKQNRLHEKIVMDRIKRRLVKISKIIKIPFLKKGMELLKTKSAFFYKRLVDLERKYKLYRPKKEHHENFFPEEESKEQKILEKAFFLLEASDFNSAEKKFIKVISINPKNIKAYEGLGEVYLHSNQNKSAEEVWEYIIKLDQRNSDAYFKLGNLNFERGNIDLAREYYLKANKFKKHSAPILIGLSDACQLLGYNEEALSYIKEAVNLEPNNPRHLDRLIDISIKTKDKGLAENSLDKLREVNPENKKIEDYKNKIKNI